MSSRPMMGGIGALKPADETVTTVINLVRETLLEKISGGGRRSELELSTFSPSAHSYKTQVVAGTNFFVKVQLQEGDFVHVRIYRDLQGNVSLHSVADDKKEDDEILYF